jgi:hypothetical protein
MRARERLQNRLWRAMASLDWIEVLRAVEAGADPQASGPVRMVGGHSALTWSCLHGAYADLEGVRRVYGPAFTPSKDSTTAFRDSFQRGAGAAAPALLLQQQQQQENGGQSGRGIPRAEAGGRLTLRAAVDAATRADGSDGMGDDAAAWGAEAILRTLFPAEPDGEEEEEEEDEDANAAAADSSARMGVSGSVGHSGASASGSLPLGLRSLVLEGTDSAFGSGVPGPPASRGRDGSAGPGSSVGWGAGVSGAVGLAELREIRLAASQAAMLGEMRVSQSLHTAHGQPSAPSVAASAAGVGVRVSRVIARATRLAPALAARALLLACETGAIAHPAELNAETSASGAAIGISLPSRSHMRTLHALVRSERAGRALRAGGALSGAWDAASLNPQLLPDPFTPRAGDDERRPGARAGEAVTHHRPRHQQQQQQHQQQQQRGKVEEDAWAAGLHGSGSGFVWGGGSDAASLITSGWDAGDGIARGSPSANGAASVGGSAVLSASDAARVSAVADAAGPRATLRLSPPASSRSSSRSGIGGTALAVLAGDGSAGASTTAKGLAESGAGRVAGVDGGSFGRESRGLRDAFRPVHGRARGPRRSAVTRRAGVMVACLLLERPGSGSSPTTPPVLERLRSGPPPPGATRP